MPRDRPIDPIDHYAASQHNAIAVINNGAPVTYGRLARSVRQFSQALVALGLRPRQSVAIQCGDLYLHLLLILAAERCGLVSASFLSSELGQPLSTQGLFDLTLTERPDRVAGTRPIHPMTSAWIDAVAALPGIGRQTQPAPDDPVRIIRTSGTTGIAKRALLTRRMLEGRVAMWAENERMAPGQTSLIVAPYIFSVSHYASLVALDAGATLVFENRLSAGEAIARYGVSLAAMVVHQLRDIVDRLPAGWSKPAHLSLVTTGGRLAPELRLRALHSVATYLTDVYGSNEVATVMRRTEADTERYGTVVPGVMVEIVDGDDRPLPLGTQGRVRVQTPYMVNAYLDDPEATVRMFKDGWFYPGDLGVLHKPDRLEILGRIDDLINVGGIKIRPEDLEQKILSRVPLLDVAVCVIPNAEGIDEAWIASVYDAPDDRDIVARLKPALIDFPYGHVHLIKLAAIPRTETGKIKRGELKQAVTAARQAEVAPPSATIQAGGGGRDGR
jgi:acyl-coenzyme A synthetase/AMP-(fatty) acid ligase